MSASYYNIVVLGSDVAPLTCAALLAKRGFRVLVLGQQFDRADYQVGRLRLPRRPFLFASGRGQLCKRIFAELSLSQSLRRSSAPSDTPFQVSLPGHRFDVPAEPSELEYEVAREFPTLAPRLSALQRRLEEHMRVSDAFFEQDAAWPPDSLLDRRRVASVSARVAALDAAGPGLLASIGPAHPFRFAMSLPSLFGANCEFGALTDLQLTRLFVGHLRDALDLEGGLSSLCDLLVEKMRSHSGHLRLHERADQILVEDGRVRGVRLFGSNESIGAGIVVVGVDAGSVQRLLADRAPLDALFELVGEPKPMFYRYTLNAIVRSAGLPVGMKRHVFFMQRDRDSSRPENMLHVEVSRIDADRSLLCTEALLPAGSVDERESSIGRARESTLKGLAGLVPFLDRHLVLVDSPHDGEPPRAYVPDVDATLARSERRGVVTMPVVYRFRAPGPVCALPVRTPLRGLLMCNSQVAPGLGVEGQMLAAVSAAHVARRADRAREWMRKKLWTKVNI